MSSIAVWYVMRASGAVTLLLLTGVFALGIATAERWSAPRLPRFVTLALHRNVSLLSVVFLTVHVATAVIDPYAHVGLVATVVPLTAGRSPLWIGLGTVSLDLIAALIVSSLVRRHLGPRLWKGIHWATYLAWPVAIAHGLGSGSDTGALWLQTLTGLCVAVTTATVVWRLRDAAGVRQRPEPTATGHGRVTRRRVAA